MMSALSIIVAMLIDYVKPFDGRRWLDQPLRAFARHLENLFDAGEYRQGIVAWLIGVLVPTLLVGLIWWVLQSLSPILGWIWNIFWLYIVLEFKQRVEPLRQIMRAIEAGELESAAALVTQWSGRDVDAWRMEEIVAVTIETTLKSALRYMFAPIFWFVVLPGPMGLIFYVFALFLKERWGDRLIDPEPEHFGRWSNQAIFILDWIPKYLVAITFALVGNFEDAVYCCRTQAKEASSEPLWPVLSAGAGAIGVLFYALSPQMVLVEYGIKDDPDPGHLRALIGLFWRALFVWLIVIALLSFLF